MMEHIAIDAAQVPCIFDIDLAQETFTFTMRYNDLCDYYTVDVAKDGVTLVTGEKLVYGQPLFANAYNYDKLPAPTITPLDPSGKETRISKTNFGKTVLLVLDNEVSA